MGKKKGAAKQPADDVSDEEGKPASKDEPMKKYAAELLGTFALVFFGCGAAMFAGAMNFNGTIEGSAITGGMSGIGYLGISFAFGITVMMMVYAIGPISGCHINPAITIAMLVAKKINMKDAVAYIVVQFIGATLASALLLAIATNSNWYDQATNGLGQNGFGDDYLGGFGMLAAIIAEIVLTFFFLIVIFGSTHKKAPAGFAGIAIGFSLFVIHLVGIPITGTSVNPARSFGPAVVMAIEDTTALKELWVFLVAPVVGAVLAAFVWMYLLEPKSDE